MAYVNFETDAAKFRYVPLDASYPASGKNIPSNVYAFMAGGLAETTEQQFSLLETGGTYSVFTEEGVVRKPARNWDVLRAIAKKSKIPIVGIQPLMQAGNALAQADIMPPNQVEIARKNPATFLGWFFTEYMMHLPIKLRRNGVIFKCVSRYNNAVNSATPGDKTDLQNLVMAEMATTFAEIMRKRNSATTLKPWYLLGIGSAHSGIVPALEMSADERVARITAHPAAKTFYNPETIHQGTFTLFEGNYAGHDVWDRGTYENNRLRAVR